jgi:hypothetical protein
VTLGDWLRTREPAPPPALLARVQELTAPWLAVEDGFAASLVDAGVASLTRMLSARPGGREVALDLLATDAIVTYAFEAAANTPEELDALGSAALMRLGGVASSA